MNLDDFYHPITNLCWCSDKRLVNPLVNIFALYWLDPIQRISICVGEIFDLNPFYFVHIYLVQEELNVPLLLTKFCASMVSSYILDAWVTYLRLDSIFFPNYNTKFRSNPNSLIPCDKLMYSTSRVDKEISDYNFEVQKIGTPPKLSEIPVLLLTLLDLSYLQQQIILQKYASANRSNYKSLPSGFTNIPLVLVCFRYRYIWLSPT